MLHRIVGIEFLYMKKTFIFIIRNRNIYKENMCNGGTKSASMLHQKCSIEILILNDSFITAGIMVQKSELHPCLKCEG